MPVRPSKDTLIRPSLPLHLVEALAQVSVDHVLAPHNLHRKVYASGGDFANYDKFPLLLFVGKMLDWFVGHPNQELSEAEFRAAIDATNLLSMEEIFPGSFTDQPHIRVPEVWKIIPEFYDTVIQGGGYHEAWHTTRTDRNLLDPEEIMRVLWPKFPKKVTMTPVRRHFLHTVWNVLEDTMIERCGTEEQPETLPIMCTLMDHVQRMEQEHRVIINLSASEVFLGFLRDLGRGYNLDSVQETFRVFRSAYPKLAEAFREGGIFYPFLERSWLLKSSLEVVELFVDLWKVTDGLAEQAQSAPPPSCAQPGAGTPGAGDNPDPGASPGKGAQGKKKGKAKGGGGGAKENPNPSPHTGGHGGTRDPQESEEPFDKDLGLGELCGEILECPQQWYHLTVGAFINHILEKLNQQRVPVQIESGEAVWNPAGVEGDRILIAPKGDFAASQKRIQEVRPVVAALRTQLRTLFVAQRVPERVDGLSKGKSLTRRYLVETMGRLQVDEIPKRAFRQDLPALKQDLALVICADESSSMEDSREPLIRASLAIAESMSSIGQNVFAFGIRSGREYNSGEHRSETKFHRTHSVDYMIYQKWSEPFQVVSQRFDSVRPMGGTPLADGLHFSLELLRRRPETHRIVLMLTDGDPDHGHAPVLRYEQRIAKKEGMHVVGVGIGAHSGNLAKIYPEHVYIRDPEDLPKGLMKMLYDLCHRRIGIAAT